MTGLVDAHPGALPAVLLKPMHRPRLPALDGMAHDVRNLDAVPAGRVGEGIVQRLLVDLRHADVVALVPVQVHLDHARVGVLGHEFPAQDVQLLLNVLRELQGVVAGSVQRHRLRPHLIDIGAGFRFVLQNVDFSLGFIHQHRQEAPVAGAVEGEALGAVGGRAEHALSGPVVREDGVGIAVHVGLAAQEGLDLVRALRVHDRQHLGHLDDPVPGDLFEDAAALEAHQVVGEPLVLEGQESEEGGLADALPAHQRQHVLELAAGLVDAPQRADHKHLHPVQIASPAL